MSINIVKGGKLVRVASNVDGISSTEKGAGGGVLRPWMKMQRFRNLKFLK